MGLHAPWADRRLVGFIAMDLGRTGLELCDDMDDLRINRPWGALEA
jgi:hypothetical protein